jgi:hypothetical protein
MDKSDYRGADDAYEAKSDNATEVAGDVRDSAYANSDEYPVKVQGDNAPIENPIDPPDSNSDSALGALLAPMIFSSLIVLLISSRREGGDR